MKSLLGVIVIIVVLLMFSAERGSEVVGLAVVTLLLWHGIWRLIDHAEDVMGISASPLASAALSISSGTLLAFTLHRGRSQDSVIYLEKRF